MYFASDNRGPVPQEILDALTAANTGYTGGYGSEDLMTTVRQQVRDVFEAPDAEVFLVTTGTAANALALATLVDPYDTVFCSKLAHVHMDECNAPEFFTGGAKLTLVGDGDKLTPEALKHAIEEEENRGVHGPQRGAVTITQVTERGNVYSLAELSALCQTAKSYGLPVHLDGARFANAAVALDCTAAEMSWKLGVDAVSFGGTKNGLLGVEAVVLFDKTKAREFELRRKRGGHLLSKHRYLSAQMHAYLTNDLWRRLARAANDNAQYLLNGLTKRADIHIVNAVQANMIYFEAPRALHQSLQAEGLDYDVQGGDLHTGPSEMLLLGRFVCDWGLPKQDIDRFLNHLDRQ
ncbi:beta-eliminating lyase-related protein [Marivita sp. S6314]|uniref:threonine aldolase family protein n=1 Tax=Marivita sp. S6314 TaxID=2926406 RepID=UPI001FF42B0B|nr:beta-eliminating lyase-related protein [Marivita sp. S6314]MCK0149931.1 beta-eliminating lyase-related protein [Marivita sp. S6314]